ncbi:MAG: hypothetical protein K2W92_00100 [Alphaproteobacteria bacterium]|nr:hypothetical protein [Alphaproteobacteria bacterium]
MKDNLPLDEMQDWIEDNIESMDMITEVLKIQQQGAIELTKLVLEHCKEDNKTQDYIFRVYSEALQLVSSELPGEQ